jgi:hypothetical protein
MSTAKIIHNTVQTVLLYVHTVRSFSPDSKRQCLPRRKYMEHPSRRPLQITEIIAFSIYINYKLKRQFEAMISCMNIFKMTKHSSFLIS